MHDRIRDGFSKRSHGVFRDLLPFQLLDLVLQPGVALDEPQALFDVLNDSASKVLAVKDVHLISAFAQQACDITLGQEPPDVLRKEQHSCVPEYQTVLGALRYVDIDQDVFDVVATRDPASS